MYVYIMEMTLKYLRLYCYTRYPTETIDFTEIKSNLYYSILLLFLSPLEILFKSIELFQRERITNTHTQSQTFALIIKYSYEVR